MARMSAEQLHANRVARMLEKFKALRLGVCVAKTAKEFQRAVRIEAADSDGWVQCVTCSNRDRWDSGTMHAGHFVSGRKGSVLFDKRNVAVQCNRCNTYLGGNQEAYAKYMRKRYGQKVIDELLRLRNETTEYTRDKLVEMRIEYMDRVKREKRRLGI